MRVKAKDIAKELGLSTATVSLAINNRPGVNEDTRRRVLDYLESKTAEDESAGGNEKIIRMLAFWKTGHIGTVLRIPGRT